MERERSSVVFQGMSLLVALWGEPERVGSTGV